MTTDFRRVTGLPPGPMVEALRWCHRNLFSTWFDTLLTLLLIGGVLRLLPPVLDWLVFDAQWSGTSAASCRGESGACWPFVRARLDQFLFGLYPSAERWRILVGLAAAVVLLLALRRPGVRCRRGAVPIAVTAWMGLAGYLLLGGPGLTPVESRHLGGLLLNLVVSVTVLAAGLPVGVLLALGRRSNLPLVAAACAGWVEFWRSVPVVVVLFVAIILFPLFTPVGIEFDPLLRAVAALSVMMSCFLAEAFRGALDSIPAGQYEASAALGLGRVARLRHVILPQAFRVAVPQIVSLFIGLFKETTVLLIIGFHDLLGMVQAASSDPQWAGLGVRATGYVVVAMFFWVCCFGISRYGVWLERRLSV